MSALITARANRILDTIHVGLITGAMYWYCITNFTNLLAVQKPIWCVYARCALPALYSSLTVKQAYYRTSTLSRCGG